MINQTEFEKAMSFFVRANERFIYVDKNLFEMQVSEQCFCGGLMNQMNLLNITEKFYPGYYADVEYNRNGANVERAYRKTIKDRDGGTSNITCDIILHSRGQIIQNDNIIAIEMKKEKNMQAVDSDRNRLIALTNSTYSGEDANYIGIHLPIYVCRYALGVFYIISRNFKEVYLEYYKNGRKVKEDAIKLNQIW